MNDIMTGGVQQRDQISGLEVAGVLVRAMCFVIFLVISNNEN